MMHIKINGKKCGFFNHFFFVIKQSHLNETTQLGLQLYRFARGFKLELIFSKLPEEEEIKYMQQDEELVREELALWDLKPAGPLDGSVCFFPGPEDVIKGMSAY